MVGKSTTPTPLTYAHDYTLFHHHHIPLPPHTLSLAQGYISFFLAQCALTTLSLGALKRHGAITCGGHGMFPGVLMQLQLRTTASPVLTTAMPAAPRLTTGSTQPASRTTPHAL